MYVAIAGNIGSGKSLLGELLSERLGWRNVSLSQGDSANPYIDDFYEDMPSWSFQMQVYFLGLRWRAMQRVESSEQPTIVDRTIYEDAEVFARNLHNSGLLPTRDFDSFFELYSLVVDKITPPELLIYLRASTDKLLENIKKRGRSYEASIDRNYLERLNELYEDWTFSYGGGKILVIDLDVDDFVRDEAARNRVLDQICSIVRR